MDDQATAPALDVEVIQGGMGVAVSGWRLARAVSTAGQLGVVSGTALDAVHARLLQDGDPGGHLRRAYAACPLPGVAERVLDRWFRPDGRHGRPYRAHPMLTLDLDPDHVELIVLANFAEVWLATEGHDGVVGVNHLEKIQMAIGPSLYGAVLAGVDAVLMGAGIPAAIPGVLDRLAAGEAVAVRVDVAGSTAGEDHVAPFDPADVGPVAPRRRPSFLAVVSSASLAKYLVRDPATRPDGLVIELPIAGGHNAPPRGPRRSPAGGEPVYGARDQVDPAAIAALGLPFWMAGGHGTRDGYLAARAAGARGVQVGTAFAMCAESGVEPFLRQQVVDEAVAGTLAVRTDAAASPSGFPFKVAEVAGTVSDERVVTDRRRVCDLGYLRTPYVGTDGEIGYRCPSEPVDAYLRKGGDLEDTVGKLCLCNGLTATVGLGQIRRGRREPALVTAGRAVDEVAELVDPSTGTYSAADVLAAILGPA